MVNTDKTIDGKVISYEILEDGYKIYLGETPWIAQVGQYSKPMDQAKTYEENCLLQIEELTTPVEPEPDLSEQVKQNAANIDYIATMAEIEL